MPAGRKAVASEPPSTRLLVHFAGQQHPRVLMSTFTGLFLHVRESLKANNEQPKKNHLAVSLKMVGNVFLV